MAARRKQAGRGEADLEELVKSGQTGAYEALQLYRSRSNRSKLKGDFNSAISTAGKGAALLCVEYENAGFELATVMLELLAEADQDVTPENRSLINAVDSAFPAKSAHRIDFLTGAIKWSMKCGTREIGDPMLHSRLAAAVWEKGDNKIKAIYHFTAAEMPDQVWTHVSSCVDAERDQLLAYGLCQFLALESIRDASELLSRYKKAFKGAKSSDLVQFADYLVQTCKRDAGPLFQTLVTTYGSLLEQYPHILTLVLGPIALKYFNLRTQNRQPDMMNMLSSMLGGGGMM